MKYLFIGLIITILSISLSLSNCKRQNWAVLVAGSNEFYNYRHQADIFHAYHLLLKNGIPKSNIIVFAYDDIANDPENPFPGKIFNQRNGKDVYAGVSIDYRQAAVTPDNFLNVLKGKKDLLNGIGTGRVLESTKEDNVFIYFSDHGSDKVLAFPDEYLFADDLQATLVEMHQKGMYNELVFYLEACFSGSMFEDLPSNLNVYATTATNSRTSSFAEYCPPFDDIIDGISVGTCLGDEYSDRWMMHTEESIGIGIGRKKKNGDEVTLHGQYTEVKGKTLLSEVCEFGDLPMGNRSSIGQFFSQSTNEDEKDDWVNVFDGLGIKKTKTRNLRERSITIESLESSYSLSKVSSRNVKLMYLQNKARSNSYEDSYELTKEMELIAKSNELFKAFANELDLPNDRNGRPVDYTCLKETNKIYKDFCGFNERDIEHLHNFAIACSFNANIIHIRETIKSLCSKP